MIRRNALYNNRNAEKEIKGKQSKKTSVEECIQTKQPQAIINMQSLKRDCAVEISLLHIIFGQLTNLEKGHSFSK